MDDASEHFRFIHSLWAAWCMTMLWQYEVGRRGVYLFWGRDVCAECVPQLVFVDIFPRHTATLRHIKFVDLVVDCYHGHDCARGDSGGLGDGGQQPVVQDDAHAEDDRCAAGSQIGTTPMRIPFNTLNWNQGFTRILFLPDLVWGEDQIRCEGRGCMPQTHALVVGLLQLIQVFSPLVDLW